MKVNKMDLISKITTESSQELSLTDLVNIFKSFSICVDQKEKSDDEILTELKNNSEEFFNMMSKVKFV